MLKYLRIFFISLLACAFMPSEAQTSLKMSLDSAYLLMGKTTPLHIELIKSSSAGGQLILPSDSMCANVEILRYLDPDTTSISGGRVEIKQDIIIQSFDSGLYVLKPVKFVDGKDTVLSNQLALKVIPVEVDSLQTVHDFADVADIDRSFIDYLPDFVVDYGLWILALIVVVAAGVYIYYIVSRKKNPFAAPAPKPVPPYEKALADLNQLHSENLCETGREKEFYTRLTDILRVYLQGRFGVNAMEMTSTQIREVIDSREETRLSRENMNRVLETADFVKFAKVRPLPDDNVQAFNSALRFVEDTKPAPATDPEEDEKENHTKTNKNS